MSSITPQFIQDFAGQLSPNVLLFAASLFTVLVATLVAVLVKRHKFIKKCEKVPGPPAQIPFFGSVTDLWINPEDVVSYLCYLRSKYTGDNGSMFRVWVGPLPMFVAITAESVEPVLSGMKHIDKSREYNFLQPWLATGLLTSTGGKWQTRRKMLTPTFHFKILDDFIHVFNEQSAVFVSRLDEKVGTTFDIFPYITLCTLDVICETAMGRHVNAQSQSDSAYVSAVYRLAHIVQRRQMIPWLQPDWLFQFFPEGVEHKRCLSILHEFTDQVIRERKAEHRQRKSQERQQMESDDVYISKKPRLAFLDLLIEASRDGEVLSDLDIREEVDTFMFEGHDTTAAAICWTLFLIGNHPHVQEQLDEEMARVFDGDSDRPITTSDLSELKYLECCIKEALRLFPSVPILGRKLTEDTSIGGYDVPVGTTVLIVTYLLHRDARYFPEPERFQPERFFPENSRGRHPYAYVPFSAGPRNCIGQKFALMEEKVILASVLRRFRIESVDPLQDVAILTELILRPRDGIRVRLTRKS